MPLTIFDCEGFSAAHRQTVVGRRDRRIAAQGRPELNGVTGLVTNYPICSHRSGPPRAFRSWPAGLGRAVNQTRTPPSVNRFHPFSPIRFHLFAQLSGIFRLKNTCKTNRESSKDYKRPRKANQ